MRITAAFLATAVALAPTFATARAEASGVTGVMEVPTKYVKDWCTERNGEFSDIIPAVPFCTVNGVTFALHMGIPQELPWWKDKAGYLGILWYGLDCETAQKASVTGALTGVPTHIIGPLADECQ